MRLALLTFAFALSGLAFAASDADSFCTSEISQLTKIFHADREEDAKKPLIEAFRNQTLSKLKAPAEWKADEVLKEATRLPYDAYLTFFKNYVAELETKIDWKTKKTSLIRTIHSVIEAQEGDAETKAALRALVDENSIVSFSTYLTTFDHMSEKSRAFYQDFVPEACGHDGLIAGGIAFDLNGRQVFTFCPGSLLRASIAKQKGTLAWTGEVNTDTLMFTAFHELGHLLGATRASPFRRLHDPLFSCLNSHYGPFLPAHDNEILADHWGAVSLVAALKEDPKLTTDEKIDKVVVNLSAMAKGSFGGASHPRIGERNNVILGEACRYLLSEKPAASDCRLQLYGH